MIEPGEYPCWYVVTNFRFGTGDTDHCKTSPPITTWEMALAGAEWVRAYIDNYHGPYYAKPWYETSRRDVLWFLPYRPPRGEYILHDDEVAWASGREAVAVIRGTFKVL